MRQEEHSRKRTRHKWRRPARGTEETQREGEEDTSDHQERSTLCVREDGRMRKDTMMQIFVKTYGSTAIVSFQRRSSATGGEGPRHNGVT